ncbi:MAG TPA: GNAT family N-acetyltransferase [Burkholderiales bacterium]|nr:GNAT family N-acetyltransferase [Burkholderiales bacterium]
MQIRAIQPSEIEPARRLLAANGWAKRVADAAQFQLLVARSQRALVAVDNGEVIGFARALCDEISNGYLAMLVVAQSHRRRGIGQALVKAVMGDDRGITWVLRAGREGVAPFYEKLGFVRSDVAMERPRSQ